MKEKGNLQVVIDASFILKLFLPEERSEKAERLWKNWAEEGVEIFAPSLLIYEASSVLRNKVHRGIIPKKHGEKMLKILLELNIHMVPEREITALAWEIAEKIGYPALYDCFYLAVSELLSAPLWTADEELYRKGKMVVKNINLL